MWAEAESCRGCVVLDGSSSSHLEWYSSDGEGRGEPLTAEWRDSGWGPCVAVRSGELDGKYPVENFRDH